jgi:hypothetical protein
VGSDRKLPGEKRGGQRREVHRASHFVAIVEGVVEFTLGAETEGDVASLTGKSRGLPTLEIAGKTGARRADFNASPVNVRSLGFVYI